MRRLWWVRPINYTDTVPSVGGLPRRRWPESMAEQGGYIIVTQLARRTLKTPPKWLRFFVVAFPGHSCPHNRNDQ